MKTTSIAKRVQKIRRHIDREIPPHITQRLYLQWSRNGKVHVYCNVGMGYTGVAPWPSSSSHKDLDPPPMFTAHYSDGWRKIVGKILLLVG